MDSIVLILNPWGKVAKNVTQKHRKLWKLGGFPTSYHVSQNLCFVKNFCSGILFVILKAKYCKWDSAPFIFSTTLLLSFLCIFCNFWSRTQNLWFTGSIPKGLAEKIICENQLMLQVHTLYVYSLAYKILWQTVRVQYGSWTCVADPDLDSHDPYVFGHPGSG